MGEMSFALMFSAFGVVLKLQSVDSVRCYLKVSVCVLCSCSLYHLLFGRKWHIECFARADFL